MSARYFIGVDVGTASARAGVFDGGGTMLASAVEPIGLFLEPGDRAEQSSADIWRAVCTVVRRAVGDAGVPAPSIAGIGFDATCSLVVLGPGGAPLCISDTGAAERDIIVWMDHRAVDQAERINAGRHAVLDYVGGRISPEMQTPKLLWLAEHKPDVFSSAWQFFDLPDFLTWKATGSLTRSSCTVTCKWTYLAHEGRWDSDYFRGIGLGVLADEEFSRIGTAVLSPGTALPDGLSEQAALELGLSPGIAVASALIDAHAGGIGTVGAGGGTGEITSRMAYVFGTSACTMASSTEARPVPGVWGPYYDAMVPGLWLSEGGQSAAGAALDHLVTLHPASPALAARASAEGLSLVALLARMAEDRVPELTRAAELAGTIHVVPEFLGNRAPNANPLAKAAIVGLGLDKSDDSLVALYVAGLLGLGYGLRQIVEASGAQGVETHSIVVSGGAGKSRLVQQLLADTSGLPVVVTASPEPVLLGSAMLGASAAGEYASLIEAMSAMSSVAAVIAPDEGMQAFHHRRFAAFRKLQLLAEDIRQGS